MNFIPSKPIRKKFEKALAIFFIIALVVFPVPGVFVGEALAANFTKQLNYQGKLANSLGVKVPDGDYNIEFKLYDGSNNSLWIETRTTSNRVTVTNGLFSVMLGEITPIDSLNFDQALYLGVNIGGTSTVPTWDGEMSPRKKIGVVAAAMEADKLDGFDASQFLRSDATNTTATFDDLSVTGDVSLAGTVSGQGFTNAWDNAFNATTTWSGFASNFNSSFAGKTTNNLTEGGSNLYWTPERFDLRLNATTSLPNLTTLSGLTTIGAAAGVTSILGQTKMTDASSTNLTVNGWSHLLGPVGIGTDNPSAALEVEGVIAFGNGYGHGYLMAGSYGMSLTRDAGGNNFDIAILQSNGYVAIGTTTPTAHFTVWGDGTTTGRLANFVNAASTTVMSIFDNGNVGIGTTSPSNRLEVNGDSFFEGNLTTSGVVSVNSLMVANGGTITLGGVARSTWPVTGGGAAGSWWATSTDNLVGYPSLDGNYAIVIGAAATSSNIKFEVAGATKLGGALNVTGQTTLANASTTNLTASGAIYAGHFMATNALATSTLAGGLKVDGNAIFGNTYSLTAFDGLTNFNHNSDTVPVMKIGSNNFGWKWYYGADAKLRLVREETDIDSDVISFNRNNGFVGIGTSSPNNLLQVVDLIDFTNSVHSTRLGYQAGKNLANSVNNNTYVGYQAGFSSSTDISTSAHYNTAVGNQALYSNVAGSGNSVLGTQAMYYNESGIHNSAMGAYALMFNTNGNYNVANGYGALYANTSGEYNVALGKYAAHDAGTGSYNIALGSNALYGNREGGSNIAIGTGAGYVTNNSNYNSVVDTYSIFIGQSASRSNTIASTTVLNNAICIGYNCKVGASNSLVLGGTGAQAVNVGIGTTTPSNKLEVVGDGYFTGNITASNIVATGTLSIIDQFVVDTTDLNTKVGHQAGKYLQSGAQQNTFVGHQAGHSSSTAQSTSADGNTATGYRSFFSNTSGDSNSAYGSLSLYSNTEGSYNVGLGMEALYSNTTGWSNSAVGYDSMYNNTVGYDNTAIGMTSLNQNTEGYYNVALGSSALYTNSTGYQNVGVGYKSLYSNTTGTSNVGVGTMSLYRNTTGGSNSALGDSALYNNTTGSENAAFGEHALSTNSTGSYNSAFGSSALLSNITGLYNSALGYHALYGNNTGSSSVAMGAYALANNTTGSNNVALGYNAGRYQSTGLSSLNTATSSIYLGAETRGLNNNDYNSIVIGYSAIGLGANTVVLGSTTISKTILRGNIGIGTTTPSNKLEVSGDGYLSGNLTAANITATGTVSVNGKMTLVNASTTNLSVSGQTYLTGLLTGVNATLSGTLGVTGKTTLVNASTTNLTVTGQSYLIGSVGIGTTTPSARLAIAGGDTSISALTIGSGSLVSSPISGSIENDGSNLWYTDSLTNRYVLNSGNITNELTGFPNRSETNLSFDNSTRTLTIRGVNYSFYSKGVKYTRTNETVSFANTSGLWFIYYNSSGSLVASQSSWSFADVQVATVYWNGSVGLLGDERHGLAMDGTTHEYLHNTVGTRYSAGLSGTFNTPPNFSVIGGSVFDEDLLISTTTTQTLTRVLYRSGGIFTFTSPQNSFYHEVAGVIQYDNAGTLTPVSNNSYVAYWVFATNDFDTPIYTLMGQREDLTLANAQANNTYTALSLTNMPFKEMKLLYRVILKRSGTSETTIQADDYRSVSNLPSGTFLASSHNILSNLDFDTSGHIGFAGLAVDNVFTASSTFAGRVGIGTTSPIARLAVGGDAYIGGNLVATGTLSILGQSTLANASTTNLSVSGQTYLTGLLTGVNATLSGTIGVTGKTTLANASTTDISVSNQLYVTGKTTLGVASTTAISVSGQTYLTGLLTGVNATLSGTLGVTGQTTLANASTTNLTVTGRTMLTHATSSTLAITSLANTVLAVDRNGTIVATTTSDVGGVWGAITGTLSAQPDLQNALNQKVDISTTSMATLTTLSGLTSFGPASGTTTANGGFVVGSNDLVVDRVSGFVGLGTTATPESLLSLKGSTPRISVRDSNVGIASNLYNLGGVDFLASDNSANASGVYSSIESYVVDTNSAIQGSINEGGSLYFNVYRHLLNGDLMEKNTALMIDNYGRVGLGTTTPTAMLQVQGTTTIPLLNITSSSSLSAFYISNMGNVGIGTTNPGVYALNVNGTAYVNSSLTVNGAINNDSSLTFTNNSGGILFRNGNGPSITAGVNNSSLSISSNVGIGTTTPSNSLEVNGSGYFSGDLTATNITATGTMSVSGKTTLVNASTTNLSVSGQTYLAGLLTGVNATLSGTLGVTGKTTLGIASTTDISVSNQLYVTGKTTLGVASTTAISVSGQTYLTGLLTGVNATLSGTLGVTGKTTLGIASTTAISVSGQTFLAGNVGVGLTNPSTAFSVNGVASSTGLQVNGSASITGNLSLGTNLQIGNGGTGRSSFTTYGVLFGSSTNMLESTAAGTPGQFLIAGLAGVPDFVSMSGDATLSSSGSVTITASTLSGLATIGSTTGQTTLQGKAVFTNASTTNISVSGQTYLTGLLTAVNATLSGTLGVTGKTTLGVASTTAISVSGQTYLTGLLTGVNAIFSGNSTTTGVAFATTRQGGAIDVAEWIKYEGDQKPEPGEVVIASGNQKVTLTDQPYDSRAIGIVSTKPHLTMGSEYEGEDAIKLALSGRVPVKTSTENGEIKAGDLLTTASLKGYAMKATAKTVGVVAIALEDLSQDQATGTVLALISLNNEPNNQDKVSSSTNPSVLSDYIANGEVGLHDIWTIDQTSRQIKSFASLDLNNYDLNNVRSIRSATGNWSLSEEGRLVIKSIESEMGVTTKDKTTGEYYCLYVDNGESKTAKGKCEDVWSTIISSEPVTSGPESTTPTVSETIDPIVSSSTDSTETEATTTESVVSGVTPPTSTETNDSTPSESAPSETETITTTESGSTTSDSEAPTPTVSDPVTVP